MNCAAVLGLTSVAAARARRRDRRIRESFAAIAHVLALRVISLLRSWWRQWFTPFIFSFDPGITAKNGIMAAILGGRVSQHRFAACAGRYRQDALHLDG